MSAHDKVTIDNWNEISQDDNGWDTDTVDNARSALAGRAAAGSPHWLERSLFVDTKRVFDC